MKIAGIAILQQHRMRHAGRRQNPRPLGIGMQRATPQAGTAEIAETADRHFDGEAVTHGEMVIGGIAARPSHASRPKIDKFCPMFSSARGKIRPMFIVSKGGDAMPTLKDFGSFKITMYFGDEAAKIASRTLDILAGDLPKSVAREARDWIDANRGMLLAKWSEYK